MSIPVYSRIFQRYIQRFVSAATSTAPETVTEEVIQRVIMEGACVICLGCRAFIGHEKTCSCCNITKAMHLFTKMKNPGNSRRCIECTFPQCTNPNCTTCPRCYRDYCDGKCHGKQMTVQLPLWCLPQNTNQLLTYQCLMCKKQAPCRKCTTLQKISDFSDKSIHDWRRTRRLPCCLNCIQPLCKNPECKTCKVCRDPKCKAEKMCNKPQRTFRGGELVKLNDLGLCTNCNTCTKCGKIKSTGDFHPQQRKSHQRLICIECIHPKCKNTYSKTCKSCLDVKCKKHSISCSAF